MLEDIRSLLMEIMHRNLELMIKSEYVICTRIRKKLENNKKLTNQCQVKPAISYCFKICNKADKYVVDLAGRNCSCRGIPYCHVCACVNYIREDPLKYMDKVYCTGIYIDTYKNALRPLNGPNMWPEVDGWPIQPPPIKKMLGKPKKLRRHFCM